MGVAAAHCEQLEGQSQSCSVAAAKAVRAAGEGLQRAVTELEKQNSQLVQDASFFVQEVGELEQLQQRACGSVADKLDSSFSPEVLDILKGNADQLCQLKQGVVAEKQAAKEGAKKLMLWMSGSAAGQQEQPTSAATAAGQLPASDAVKQQRGSKLLQLPGSSIAAARSAPGAAGWQALKFWQVGAQHNKHAVPSSRAAAGTPGVADQQPQMQKSLSSMLFGKQKRHSSGGAEGAAANRRLSIDPAASWRSSVDGSLNGRRASARSSEAGAAAGAAGAAPGAFSSLAAGEGPLSKSHSLLATKPGTQQEQILGKSLEIVAEDEREGRDSPAPAELPGRRAGSVGQPAGLAPIRVPRGSLGLGNRPGSPVDSFSFGPRAEEEQPQSPSFLRASSAATRMGQQAGMAGPLVRSSMALRASSVARLDPFEAPEPEPQPFVEQLRAEQQQESVGGSGAQTGLMAALRRSISGAGSNSRRTPRQSVEGAAWANRQAQQAAYHQQQQQQERTQQAPEAGVQFLDLDATRAYALGVHQVMMRLEQGMQSHHSQSEASSKPASPRMASCFAEAAAAPAPAEAAAAVEADAADAAGSEEQALSEGSSHRQLQEGEGEVQDDGDEAAYRQSAQSAPVIDSRPTETGPLSAGQHTLHAGDAAVMPPLRSGMSSPAAGRRQTLAAASRAGSAAPRQLPLMGQASMEILQTRPQHQQLQQQGSLTASRQASLVGASTSLSLAEVYKQTSGNLTPLSSHLSGIGRRPSSGANKAHPGPQQFSSSRSILGEAGPQAGGPASGGLGPLSMQYGSTMQQAKKSAHAAGLAAGAPEQQRVQGPAGWSGPSPIPAAGTTPEGGDAAGANNKYASSWGILDAGGLSRQSSMNGVTASRAPSTAQLGRQGSGSVRASPRVSTTDDGTWQQQQRLRGAGAAAGRYAGTSLTPGSQSPRSGTATPAREDSSAAMGQQAQGRQASAAGRGRRAGGAGREQREQAPAGRGGMQARDGSTAGSDGDYESAEEQLSSGPSGLSGLSGLSGPYGSANGGGTAAAGSTAGLPRPPTFAQAAVATQWSPSKNAAAYSQAPAYMRDAVLRISPEMSGSNVGLAPQGLTAHSSRGVSPWDGSSSMQGVPPPGCVSSSSIGASRTSHASGYDIGSGSINIYAPLDPPAPRSSSGRLSQQQQQYRPGGGQQQAPVVTAVDLARRSSMMRRGSSQGGEYMTGLSSNGRTSSSNIGYIQGSSPSSGYGGTVGGRQGGQQQQQQWGQGSMHSAGIYGTIRPQQWQQRTQYRL